MKKVNKNKVSAPIIDEEAIKRQVVEDEARREALLEEAASHIDNIMTHISEIKTKQNNRPNVFAKFMALICVLSIKLIAFYVFINIVVDALIRLR